MPVVNRVEEGGQSLLLTARPKEPTELEQSFAIYGISEVESLFSVSVTFVMMLKDHIVLALPLSFVNTLFTHLETGRAR